MILANLFMLLLGFALLARYFEESRVPAVLPRYLPDGWLGGFVLLMLVFVLSSFLDNIAAAMIGGAIAATRCSAARYTSATSPPSSRRPMPAAQAASSATPRRR